MKATNLCPLLLILLLFTACPCAGAQNLLPMPRRVEWARGHFDLHKPYRVANEAGEAARNVYLDPLVQGGKEVGDKVLVIGLLPDAEGPEAYDLRITADSLVVRGAGAEALLRAGQTLAQLRTGDKLPACHIADRPAFGWRGCMIDVSRHFFTPDQLKKQIRLLAAYKINRLHLHLTDAGGWRMQIKRYPLLTKRAAWRTESDWKKWWIDRDRRYMDEGDAGAYGGYYTQDELRDLVRYARDYGMEVVPEIEMPGHSEEVLTVYPAYACRTADGRDSVPASGDFCLGNEDTYAFLQQVLDEVMEVFPSEYIHIGGDEANMTAWRTCPRCQAKLKELGATEVTALQRHMVRRMSDYLQQRGRRLLGWDEIIDDGLGGNTSVMVWRNALHAMRAADKGYDVVMAPASHCYVNCDQDAPDFKTNREGSYLSLQKVYSFNPLDGMTPAQAAHVRGVQACLWTEGVATLERLEDRLYPRLLALAEVGWNDQEKEDYKSFRRRALKETRRLRAEGVAAFDLAHEKGERKESLRPVRHKAAGAKVTYHKPINRYYPAAGEATLTDGLRGGWHHGDGRWQGFIGGDCLDVTVDLGKVQKVSSVSMDFIQNAGPEIFLPAQWVIEVSADGTNYREVHRRTSTQVNERGLQFHTWTWRGKARARYLRIKASSFGERAWLFTDEIVVR